MIGALLASFTHAVPVSGANNHLAERLRLLHLEDNLADVRLAQIALEEAGVLAEVVVVSTRQEFAAALAGPTFDIILADYALPGFDGLTALELAKEACPDTPFIFVTGQMGEDRAIDSIKLGATDYVLKGRLSRLAPAVRRALAEASERRERRRAEAELREARDAAERAALDAADSAARTDRLQAVTAALSGAVTPVQVAQAVLSHSLAAVSADAGAILMVDSSGTEPMVVVQHAAGFPANTILPPFPLAAPFPAAEAIRTQTAIWLESAEAFARRYPSVVPIRQETHQAASAYVPLRLTDHTIGCLALSFVAPRQFEPEQQQLALTLGRLCAQALERARLYDTERILREVEHRSHATADLLAKISSTLASTLSFPATLQNAARLAVPVMADFCQVYVCDTAGAVEHTAAAHARPELLTVLRELTRRVQPGADNPRNAVTAVLMEGQQAYLPGVTPEQFDPRIATDARLSDLWARLAPRVLLALPLRARGRTLGAVVYGRCEPAQPLAAEDLKLAQEVAHRAALALDNARLHAETAALNFALEQRVQERTLQLEHANRQLEESYAQLRNATARMTEAREDERARLAREVHDELGGSLTALKIELARMEHASASLGTNPQAVTALQARLTSACRSIDHLVRSVRRIATELRPSVLDDFGLLAALEWQLNEFRERSGLECRFDSQLEAVTLDANSATTVFRVFQETLTNIARHSQASCVGVEVRMADGSLVLEVHDNGRGISRDELTQTRSLGLVGMRERVAAVKGKLEIDGAPGQGTTVSLAVPVTSNQ
jgi:signal transduction histidine kinase/DNA-binding NarL/FixJ family response regulator